jgi:hypothetical protein
MDGGCHLTRPEIMVRRRPGTAGAPIRAIDSATAQFRRKGSG